MKKIEIEDLEEIVIEAPLVFFTVITYDNRGETVMIIKFRMN